MMLTSLLKKAIKEKSKKITAGLLLTCLILTGCTNVPVKRANRVWLIDPETQVLYRVLSDEYEIALPLSNPNVRKFMCLEQEEYNQFVDGVFLR